MYVSLAVPSLSGYLMNPVVLLGQPVPYVVCGAIWLTRKSPEAAAAGRALAALLFAAALVLYLPIVWVPAKHGGDMIGLFYILVVIVTTSAVLAGSVVAGLVLWLRHRARADAP